MQLAARHAWYITKCAAWALASGVACYSEQAHMRRLFVGIFQIPLELNHNVHAMLLLSVACCSAYFFCFLSVSEVEVEHVLLRLAMLQFGTRVVLAGIGSSQQHGLLRSAHDMK
jgi:hypothetical protein